MKTIYILLITALCACACTEILYEDVVREVEPEKPTAVHYYYSYKAEEVINASNLGYTTSQFTPGCTYIMGDTLFIANTQNGAFSVELYSLSEQKKIASLTEWTYKGERQTFQNYVEAISVSDGKLYLANIGSSIDIFDVKTLNFITRIGDRNWGESNTRLFHTHAMTIVGDYIIIRTKNRLQVTLQSEATPEKYQNINFYSRGVTEGFDVNNAFKSHQMAIDTTGVVYLADYGQYGNSKIHVIDTSLIKKGNNVVMTTPKTMLLNFNPTGIAFYKELMYVTASDGSIRIYDRNKESFIHSYKSVVGYSFSRPEKMTMQENRLWVTDTSKKAVIGIDIYRYAIEEYD